MTNLKNTLSLIILIFLISCDRNPQEFAKNDPDIPKIQSNDINLIKKFKKPFADFLFARKNLIVSNLNDENSINDFIKLGQLLNDDQIVIKAHKAHTNYMTNHEFSDLVLNDAIYIELIKQQSEQALAAGIDQAEKEILIGVEIVKKIFVDNNQAIKNVTANDNLDSQLNLAKTFIAEIIYKISEANINNDLKTKLLESLNKEGISGFIGPEKLNQQLKSAATLGDAVTILREYIQNSQTVLLPEDQIALQNANKLGLLIDKMNDEKNALQALAMAWSMLNTEERIINFKSANEKLYDFLHKKSDSEIQCLINGNCDGFFKKLILKFGVYPAIEEYGVNKIKETLNLESLKQVNFNVQKQAYLTISMLDHTISQKITDQVHESLHQLNQFKSEFAQQIASGLGHKLKSNVIKLFSTNQEFDFSREFKISLNQILLIKDNDHLTQIQLIEKLLQFMKLGTDFQKNAFSSSIKQSLQDAHPRFYINNSKVGESNLLVKDQAHALIFFSNMLKQLSDWRTTHFDSGITEFIAQDFVTQFQSPELNRKLFQKTELVGMALSLAAQVLKQTETDQSVIYLLDLNNQRISIRDYLNDISSSPLVHAAASSYKNRIRTNLTTLSDLCLLIQAYSEYYEAIENIQLSKSESLKNPDLMKQVLNSRHQIKLLILTLANFISNQLINDDKTINNALNFQTGEKVQSLESLDYALAINALTRAYQITGIDIYKMSALELYYKLNQNYYADSIKFYKVQLGDQNTKVHQEHLVKMFNYTYQLRSLLDLTSQLQYDRIFEYWLSQF